MKINMPMHEKFDPKFDPEEYSCTGDYVGPRPPLPKNMEIMARVYDEYVNAPVEPDFDKLLLKTTREVEALYPEFRYEPHIINSNPYAPAPSMQDEDVESVESESSESTDEIIYSEEDSSWEFPKEVFDLPQVETGNPRMDLALNGKDLNKTENPNSNINLPEKKRRPENVMYELANLNAKLVVPGNQKWSDLTEVGYKSAVAMKYMQGKSELAGPLAFYFGAGAAEMKKKLAGSQEDFNEAVSETLAGMMIDNMVLDQSVTMAMLLLDNPLSPSAIQLLKKKHQIEKHILQIIDSRQKLVAPIKIRNAQVNIGQVQKIVNRDDGKGG